MSEVKADRPETRFVRRGRMCLAVAAAGILGDRKPKELLSFEFLSQGGWVSKLTSPTRLAAPVAACKTVALKSSSSLAKATTQRSG